MSQNVKASTLLLGSLAAGLSAVVGLSLSTALSDMIVRSAISNKLPIFPFMLIAGLIPVGISWRLSKRLEATLPPTLTPQFLIASSVSFALGVMGVMLIIYAVLSLSSSRPM